MQILHLSWLCASLYYKKKDKYTHCGRRLQMDYYFQLLVYFLMGVIHGLTIDYFSDDKLPLKKYFGGVIPFWGNFYVLQYRKSPVGFFYAILRLLEIPALSLVIASIGSGYYNALCLVLIILSLGV